MGKLKVVPQSEEELLLPTCVCGKWMVICPICDQPQPSPHGKDRPAELPCLYCHYPIHFQPKTSVA